MAIEVTGVVPLVQVFDMPRSIGFYRDVLGFEVAERSKAKSDNPDDVDWCSLQLGPANLMLNTAYDPDNVPEAPNAARWEGHQDTGLFFGCPDVDAAYRHLVEKGVDVEPPKVAWYGMKQLYLKDPDGYGICLQWRA
jgi:catechol 2,3-dioxygenase-like lactoylglutathione lyase family enzyme